MPYKHVPPTLYRPQECTPNNTPNGHLPAEVEYLSGNRVRVTHAEGEWHRNAVLARERLARRGYRVVPPKTPNPAKAP